MYKVDPYDKQGDPAVNEIEDMETFKIINSLFWEKRRKTAL